MLTTGIRRGPGTLLAAMAVLGMVSGTPRTDAGDILPHRATYNMTYRILEGGDAGSTATGTVQWTTQDHCETWMFHELRGLQRVLDDGTREFFSETLAFEAKDGSWFRFSVESRGFDGENVSSGEAVAGRSGGPGSIVIEEPEAVEVELPARAVFPVRHLIDILERARNGERIMSHVVFDGTDGVEVDTVSTVVGRAEESAGQTVWTLHVAIFASGETDGPKAHVTARVRDDGVFEKMDLSNGNVAIVFELASIEELPRSNC